MLEPYTVRVFTLEEYSDYFGSFKNQPKLLKPEDTYKLYAKMSGKANRTILSLMDENQKLRTEIAELNRLVSESVE